MRILHLIPILDLGGAPRGLLELVQQQQDLGHRCKVVVLGNSDNSFGLDDFDLEVLFLNEHWRFSSWSRVRRIQFLLEAEVNSFRCDVIHSHLPAADYVAAIVAARTGTKHVSHLRGTLPWLSDKSIRSRLKRWRFRTAFRNAKTHFVSVSRNAGTVNRKAFDIRDENIQTVINGISPQRFPEISISRGDIFHIGYAGRLVSEKGVDILIDALSNLSRDRRDFIASIAGIGGKETELRRRTKELGIENRVKFVGKLSEINTFYRSLDAFVLPSIDSEGLARVILEAMYCGVPVIATRGCGSEEAIDDQSDGLLVQPGSSRELSDCLGTLLDSTKKRESIALAAKAKARERFTVERVAAEIDQLYNSLLN